MDEKLRKRGGFCRPPGSGPVWPCTFDLFYQKQPFGYNKAKRFSTGVAHMCWTGSPSVVPTVVAGMRAWLDAAPEATIISLSEEDGGEYKTVFLSHLYINAIVLPRQARDKHRENSKKGRFLAGVRAHDVRIHPESGATKLRGRGGRA